eukprot:gene36310-44794_t
MPSLTPTSTAQRQQAVLAFTLFSSLLDAPFRTALAQQMWQWVAPGGGVLVYDFVVNNPRNPDVQGVPLAELGCIQGASRWHRPWHAACPAT